MYISSSSIAGLQADQLALVAALDTAHARSQHSYFTQYILTDEEAGYVTIDAGDYGVLPAHLMERVIDSVPGHLSDEF